MDEHRVDLEQPISSPPVEDGTPLLSDGVGPQRLTSTMLGDRRAAVAAAFGGHGLGTWRWELDHDRIELSARARALLAPCERDLPQAAPRFLSLLPLEDRHALLVATWAVLRGGGALSLEVTLDGRRPMRVRFTIARCPTNPSHLAGTLEPVAD